MPKQALESLNPFLRVCEFLWILRPGPSQACAESDPHCLNPVAGIEGPESRWGYLMQGMRQSSQTCGHRCLHFMPLQIEFSGLSEGRQEQAWNVREVWVGGEKDEG